MPMLADDTRMKSFQTVGNSVVKFRILKCTVSTMIVENKVMWWTFMMHALRPSKGTVLKHAGCYVISSNSLKNIIKNE